MRKKLIVFILLALTAAVLAACGGGSAAPAQECPDCPDCPEIVCPKPLGGAVPFEADWASSGHADSAAEAFRHWDEEDDGLVAESCVRCHSTAGYIDYNGGDGSAAGTIENEVVAADNMGVQCAACHNPAVVSKTSVVMPSGLELTDLGDSARCIECHQGRESQVSVNARILESAGVEDLAEVDPDAVLEDLGFSNIHYFAAAVSKFGTLAKGGYEYAGKAYDGEFAHVEEFDSCNECHSPHTLEVQLDSCTTCHGEGDPSTFRMEGSTVDYDGDGDLEEGIASEIAGLQDVLMQALAAYSQNVIGDPIVYNGDAYPYFFIDLNGDGQADDAESIRDNGYASWTPRLAEAAYNLQLSMKDPGGFAHGGKYIIQLLYDSIADLDADMASGLARDDSGHFQGSAEAFRHWDEEGEVPGSCSRCHSAAGLPLFVTQGVAINQEISNGFQCSTCHGGEEFPARYQVSSVTFPSGASVAVSTDKDEGLCMSCHQGQASTVDVNKAVAGIGANSVSEDLAFINVHYFASGATRYGTEVQGGYEFAGKTYVGYFEHVDGFQACTDCHDAHELEVKTDNCFTCHAGVDDVKDIRKAEVDYDGDGDLEEGVYYEIDGLRNALYAAIQDYAANAGAPILYETSAYPYFFNDTDGDGAAGPGEAIFPNSYKSWTPNLLKAAYNLQYAYKDPGGFAHNSKYVVELLIDSIQAVGGSTSSYTRP
ncbi:MAG: cytochrome c3 family protein [Anaerolineales bacterium]